MVATARQRCSRMPGYPDWTGLTPRQSGALRIDARGCHRLASVETRGPRARFLRYTPAVDHVTGRGVASGALAGSQGGEIVAGGRGALPLPGQRGVGLV